MADINPADGNPTPPANPNSVNPPTAPMVVEIPKPPMTTSIPATPSTAPIHEVPLPIQTPPPATQPVVNSQAQQPIPSTTQQAQPVIPTPIPPAAAFTHPATPIDKATPPPAAATQPQPQPQTFPVDLKPGDKVAPTPVEILKKAASNQPQTDKKPDGTPLEGEEKIFAAIGYIGILALVPLLVKRDSEFCQHHGRQALVIAIVFIFLWMISAFSYSIAVLTFILQLVAIVGGFLLAFKGDWFRVPGIYELSLKLDWRKKLQTPPQS